MDRMKAHDLRPEGSEEPGADGRRQPDQHERGCQQEKQESAECQGTPGGTVELLSGIPSIFHDFQAIYAGVSASAAFPGRCFHTVTTGSYR